MNDPASEPASDRFDPATLPFVPLATVPRDPSFTRVAADVSFATTMGDDVDIALMIRQAVYRDVVMGEDDQPEEVSVSRALIEVARLRMPAQGAMLMALQIFEGCAVNGGLDLDNFDENIADIRAAIVKADKEAA